MEYQSLFREGVTTRYRMGSVREGSTNSTLSGVAVGSIFKREELLRSAHSIHASLTPRWPRKIWAWTKTSAPLLYSLSGGFFRSSTAPLNPVHTSRPVSPFTTARAFINGLRSKFQK